MPHEPTAKVFAAATECLRQCSVSRMPWKAAARYIDTLKVSTEWTDAEIVEVMRAVVATLLQELAKKSP